jgi:hypothetical protein
MTRFLKRPAMLMVISCFVLGAAYYSFKEPVSDAILLWEEQFDTGHLSKTGKLVDYGRVIYARTEIQKGTLICSGDLIARDIKPKKSIPKTAITRISLATKRRATHKITKGAIITSDDLKPFIANYCRDDL